MNMKVFFAMVFQLMYWWMLPKKYWKLVVVGNIGCQFKH